MHLNLKQNTNPNTFIHTTSILRGCISFSIVDSVHLYSPAKKPPGNPRPPGLNAAVHSGPDPPS